MYGAWHDSTDARNQTGLVADGHNAGGSTHYVDHVADANPGADSVPVGVEGTGGYRDSGAQAQPRGPLFAEMSRDLVARGIAPAKLRANACQSRIETGEEIFRGQPAQGSVPH